VYVGQLYALYNIIVVLIAQRRGMIGRLFSGVILLVRLDTPTGSLSERHAIIG